MKKEYILNILLILVAALYSPSCKDDPAVPEIAPIELNGTPLVYEYLNENDVLEIPVKYSSTNGLKKAFYKLVSKNENSYKYSYSTEYSIPVSGNSLDITLSIPVAINLYSVVIAVSDNNDVMSVETVKIEEVKKSPEITFKNGINTRKVVAIGIPFNIYGNVQSENELKQLSFIPVKNGQMGTPVQLGTGDKSNVDFVAEVPVEAGLQYVLIKAENIFEGVSIDTFYVESVVNDDFITLTMNQGITELSRFFEQESNAIQGSITSGSDIKSLRYAITKEGVEGTMQDVSLDDVTNEAEFSIDILGEQGMENVKLVAENDQGKVVTLNLTIPDVLVRLAEIDVEMSTDPADNKAFLALYHAPYVFGYDEAFQNQEMIDWILVNRGNSAQPVSGLAYSAGETYYNAISPYIPGFTKLTYLFLSSRRSGISLPIYNTIEAEQDILTVMENYGSYNIYTGSRRVGDYYDPSNKKDGAFIIGWGTHTHPEVSPAVVNNVAWAMVWVKQVILKSNGHYQVSFHIKYPKDDKRTPNNESMIAPYDPYPL
ncbi:MAG: hypothetical protein ACK5M7_04195 [Draconibacterium sp.]